MLSLLTFVTKLYQFFCKLIVEKIIVLVVIVEINKFLKKITRKTRTQEGLSSHLVDFRSLLVTHALFCIDSYRVATRDLRVIKLKFQLSFMDAHPDVASRVPYAFFPFWFAVLSIFTFLHVVFVE